MSSNQIDWDTGKQGHHANPLMLIHRSLRGRYVLTIVLAIVFGALGGTLGYLSRQPLYKSTGVVRIQPSLPKVLYETEQSTAPRMFASLVNSHAQFITNVEVVRLAMEDDAIKAEEARLGEIFDINEVMQNIRVMPDRRAQEIIRVSYEDEDARISEAIVNAILDAYIEKYGKEGSIKSPAIVSVLNGRKATLEQNLNRKESQIYAIVEKYKTENLAPLITENNQLIDSLNEQKSSVDRMLAVLDNTGKDANGVGGFFESPEDAAEVDTRMAELIQQREQLIENRKQMMVAEGLREEHRDVRRVTMMIENIENTIDERLAMLQSAESPVLYDAEGNLLPTADTLRERQQDLANNIAQREGRAKQLFEDSRILIDLQEEATNLKSSLALVESRLDTIDVESQYQDSTEIAGKISIESRPFRAKEPTSDPRIKMAGAGFIGAGSIPVILILALGYLSHRVNYSDDEVLTGARAGIVGMLPDLGNSLDDQELASASAFAVHQIRSQLQIKNNEEKSRVYGVTSPAPGDGKTSLIIAMGLSFAESGNRTLLVDLDFIGRGLSVHFGHTRSPSLADRLTESDEVAQLIHDTEFPGLSILPAGYGDDLRVSKLSPRSLEALLAPLRENYDTILVDTGPILGSVEAAFVAPQADGVLLVVGRGQYKPLIKKAIDQIHAVDGDIAATIFNRASAHEIRHSTSSMSVHFSRQFSRQQQEAEARDGSRVGPLAGTLFTDRESSSKMRKASS